MNRPARLAAFALALLGAAAPAAAAKEPPLFVPVYQQDFADPSIVEHRGEYIGYATNRGLNLPMITSRDLVNWEVVKDPGNPGKPLDGMPELGAWAREDFTWAPEVTKIGGRWVLYYTARHRKKDIQCIGVATSADPRGPFRDALAEPLVCQPELGGTIDANLFRDTDDKLYLYFKNDGNHVAKPTELWGQRLSADGTGLVGAPVRLGMTNDKPWEAHVIEAPTMVRTATGYTMLYSANHYGWETHQRLSPYAMGYAICAGPMGPCTDAPDNPILHSFNDRKAGCLSGPGHQVIFRGHDRYYIGFHAWAATPGCRPLDKKRYLYIAPIGFTAAGKPVISPSLRPAGK
ncbi:MAG TPA: glycoside hydrolase family 43 protein [Allosphingosinicella sp.]